MKMKGKENYNVQAVSQALDILEQFNGSVAELGVRDLSNILQLSKNKIFRLLATLQRRNFVEHDLSTENYRLGLKTVEMGQLVVRQRRHLHKVRPIMEALARECKETICLSMLNDYHAVNVHVVEGVNPLRVVPRTGGRVPVYCTSAGKAQIAHLSEDTLTRYLAGCQLYRHTPATITDSQLLLTHLQQVSRQGYALELEELEEGVTSVSAPVRDYTLKVISAITCYVPSLISNEKRIGEELVPFILKGAAEISAMLGCTLPSERSAVGEPMHSRPV